jgi:hypothetical protein
MDPSRHILLRRDPVEFHPDSRLPGCRHRIQSPCPLEHVVGRLEETDRQFTPKIEPARSIVAPKPQLLGRQAGCGTDGRPDDDCPCTHASSSCLRAEGAARLPPGARPADRPEWSRRCTPPGRQKPAASTRRLVTGEAIAGRTRRQPETPPRRQPQRGFRKDDRTRSFSSPGSPPAGRAFVGTPQPIPAKTDRPNEPLDNPAQPAQLHGSTDPENETAHSDPRRRERAATLARV